jgi:hypothetical protein
MTTISTLTNDLTKSITSTLLPVVCKYLEDGHKVKVSVEELAKVLNFEYKAPAPTTSTTSTATPQTPQGFSGLSTILPLSSTQTIPTVPRTRSTAAKTGKCVAMITRGPRQGQKCEKSCAGSFCLYHTKKSSGEGKGKSEGKKKKGEKGEKGEKNEGGAGMVSNVLANLQSHQETNVKLTANIIEGSTTDLFVDVEGVKTIITRTADGTHKFVAIAASYDNNNNTITVKERRDATKSEREVLQRNHIVFDAPSTSGGLGVVTVPTASSLSSLTQSLSSLSLGVPDGLSTLNSLS